MSKVKRISSSSSPSSNTVDNIQYGLKGLLLYILPIPVLIAAIIALIKGSFFATLTLSAASVGFFLAAVLTRHGLKLEKIFEQKKFAKAPRVPYKSVSALLLAITTALTAVFAAHYGLFQSILLGGTAFLGYMFSYGLDPRRDKTANVLGLGVTSEEVIKALEAAEIRIASLEEAKQHISSINFKNSIDRITLKAREILTIIEEDPRDLDKARKFLKTYLKGAERVTATYVKTHQNDATTEKLDSDFNQVLNSIEETFNKQHKKLKENDQFDLDVQIQVLETQLKESR
jgi:5-bromo-4-chloroindolyl phosphate hydrolysis protein